MDVLTRVSGKDPSYRFDHSSPDVGYVLGLAYLGSGNLQGAKTELAKVLARFPGSLVLRLLNAKLSFKFSDYRRSAKLAQGILEDRPDNLQAALILGPALLRAGKGVVFGGDGEQVVRVLQEAASSPGGFAALHESLGDFHQSQGAMIEAEAAYRTASDLEPENGQMHLTLAGMLLGQGRLKEAEAYVKASIELDGLSARSHLFIGTLEEMRGARQDAIESYEKSLDIAPHLGQAANNLAFLLAETDSDLQRAWALAAVARSQFPDDPNVLDTMGWVSYKAQNYETAVGLLERCVQMVPTSPSFRFHLGMACYKSGNAMAAKSSLDESLKLGLSGPNSVDVQEVLASLAGKVGGL